MASRSHSSSRSQSQSRGILTASANEAKSRGYTDSYRRPSNIDHLFAAAHESIASNRLPPVTTTTTQHHHHHVEPVTSTSSYTYTRPAWNENHVSHHGSTTSLYVSPVERLILDSTQPIETPKPSIVETIPGTHLSGVLLNPGEAEEWSRRTGLDIKRYTINNNFNDAELITRNAENIEVVQELGVRYLKPPLISPPPIIVQQTPKPGPPIIIRTQDEQEETMIFREEPPPKPHIDIVTLEVDVPSNRKVIVEKLPARPRSVIIEKWLPYRFGKREVRIVQARPAPPQRNVIIQWNAASVRKIRKCKDLGVVHADPEEYKRLYGSTLLKSHQLPTCDDHEFNFGLSSSSANYHAHHTSSTTHASHVKDMGNGYHLVTQRADCPCKGDCKCQCHSGGYVINTGVTHHTQATASSSITTRPVQTTTTVVNSSNPLFSSALQGCVCCCSEKPEQQITTITSQETCCTSEIQTTECGADCVCCCHTGTFGGGGYYYPDGRAGAGCCCRSNLTSILGISVGANGHLDNCRQLGSVNGKCPIHQGNQYGSAGYKSGHSSESNLPELYGDVHSLKAVADKLRQVGLGEYENFVRRL